MRSDPGFKIAADFVSSEYYQERGRARTGVMDVLSWIMDYCGPYYRHGSDVIKILETTNALNPKLL